MKTEYAMPCGSTATITTYPKIDGVKVSIEVDLGNGPMFGLYDVEGWNCPDHWRPFSEKSFPDGSKAREWTVKQLRTLDAAVQSALVSAASRKFEADHCMDNLAI